MIAKKLHFPKFYLFPILLLVLFACNKKPSIPKEQKINTAYKIYFDYAEKYFGNSQYNRSFFYYNKSKLVCNPFTEKDKIIYSVLKMAAIQQIQGDYASSETTATEAIPFFDKTTNYQYKVAIYNILGINYEKNFDYDNAIKYYNQALKISEEELPKTILKNNIAVVYMANNDFYRAIQILSPLSP